MIPSKGETHRRWVMVLVEKGLFYDMYSISTGMLFLENNVTGTLVAGQEALDVSKVHFSGEYTIENFS